MPLILIPAALLASFFVAYALAFISPSTNAGLLGWIASKVASVPIFGGFTAEQLLKLDQWMAHYIGRHFQQVEAKGIGWLAGMRQYVGYMAAAPFELAVATYTFANWLLSIALPNRIAAGTAGANVKAAQAEATAEAAAKAAAGIAKGRPGSVTRVEVTKVERVAMPHAREWDWLHRHWEQVTAAVLGAAAIPVTHVLPKVEPIAWPFGLTPTGIRRRLRRLESLTAPLAIAAALSLALGVSRSCLRPGGNIQKIAKRLCGLGSTALDDLLGLLVDVLLVEDVCQVVTLLEDGLHLIQGPIDSIVGVVGGSLCHGDYAAPPDLPALTLSLPPVTGLVPLAA